MTTITIRERDPGFAVCSADQLIKLALVAANSSIWLYVTGALGLAA